MLGFAPPRRPMLGYGVKLYHKIALLAAGQNEGKQATLNATDTFVSACPSNDNTEIEATDALDQLYRSGCQVYNVPKKKFLKMHASEEDLKMMVALLKPRYYIPVKGFYKDLLANAEVALSMRKFRSWLRGRTRLNSLPVVTRLRKRS